MLSIMFSHVFGSGSDQLKDFRHVAGKHGLKNNRFDKASDPTNEDDLELHSPGELCIEQNVA